MKLILFLIFLFIPFGNISIGGHLYPIEIPVYIGSISILPVLFLKAKNKLISLDYFVLFYLLWNLVSVLVGADDLYGSARYYRVTVLIPVLLYLLIRYSTVDLRNIHRFMFLVFPGLLYEALLITDFYIENLTRPLDVDIAPNLVTLSVLFSLGLSLLLFSVTKNLSFVWTILKYAVAIVLLGGLIVTFTRAAVVSFFVLCFVIPFIWKKTSRIRIFGLAVVVLPIGLIISLIGSSFFVDPMAVAGEREIQRSMSRLWELDLYLRDIQSRVALWSRVIDWALEHPMLGRGASSFAIGSAGVERVFVGSSHNLLISALVTSGLPGVAGVLGLIASTFMVMSRAKLRTPEIDAIGQVVLLNFTLLVVVALTNDLTGGRSFLLFMLMGLAARVRMIRAKITRGPSSARKGKGESGPYSKYFVGPKTQIAR